MAEKPRFALTLAALVLMCLASITSITRDVTAGFRPFRSMMAAQKLGSGQNCFLNDSVQNDEIPSMLDQCQTILSSSQDIVDNMLAFFPEWKLVVDSQQPNHEGVFRLAKDANRKWMSEYWRTRQSIQWPKKPVPCSTQDTIGRQVNYYLGSQVFTDLKYLLYTNKTYYRHLNISHNVYMKNLESPPGQESAAMSNLRKCLLNAHAAGRNAISCIYLPTSDCIPPRSMYPEMTGAPDTSMGRHDKSATKEEALCSGTNDVEARNQCIHNQVKPAVPISPLLNGSQLPDVSKMALFLFEQELHLAAPMRHAVQEIVNSQTMKMPCVAIHIRRGDKLPECGMGKQVSCAFQKNWTDYADVGLNFMKQLNSTSGGTLFVMTDDAKFLKGKKVNAPNIQVAGLAGSTPPDLQRADGLKDLTILLASLEVATRCEAAVGNSESEVFELMVLWNCVRRGVCPSVYSMNGSPTQGFATHIVDGRASSVLDKIQ